MVRIRDVLLVVCSIVGAKAGGCPLALSVDISIGKPSGNAITHGGLTYNSKDYFYHEGITRGCVCNLRKCIRKCCEPGEAMVNATCTPHDQKFSLDIYEMDKPLTNKYLDEFYYIHNKNCSPIGYYKLVPQLYDEDLFYVQPNGYFYMPKAEEEQILPPERFCMERFFDDDFSGEISALVCFADNKVDKTMYSYGMIISMPFLLVTFLVYALLPDRNLHGKSLMCYVISLFWAYVFLVYIQLHPHQLENGPCKALGLMCLFFFMVSFFWMNVMSIDIWWAFSGLRGFSGSKRDAERKRFLLYTAYAWGMPFLHVALVMCLTFSESIPKNAWYNPNLGDGQCWFRDGIPNLLYFYGPMAALIFANVTLFVITACKIKRVQQDTAMLKKDESKKHSYENDKQRFNLYVKLMLAMGVNWSMEIISWALNWKLDGIPPAVWYITDFCNALYGVFIFFIFVFKRNIWKLLKRRYYMFMGKPHLARSMTQTAYSPRTTASSISQTVVSDIKINDASVLTDDIA